jgi:hypothetical protein
LKRFMGESSIPGSGLASRQRNSSPPAAVRVDYHNQYAPLGAVHRAMATWTLLGPAPFAMPRAATLWPSGLIVIDVPVAPDGALANALRALALQDRQPVDGFLEPNRPRIGIGALECLVDSEG